VRDTGLGIEAEEVDKVFFVFRRGKNTVAQNIAGKGVGLASVKSIIETYGGRIWVESTVGQGSTFRFTVNGAHVPATGRAQALDAQPSAAEQTAEAAGAEDADPAAAEAPAVTSVGARKPMEPEPVGASRQHAA
jgi:hypothetical protein